MKKTLIILIFLLPLITKGRELEIDYPNGPVDLSTPLEEYVSYIINFIVGMSGFIAFISLIIAGLTYLSSAGDPNRLGIAKKRMISAFVGLLIILSSFLILREINPFLIELKDPQVAEIPEVEEVEKRRRISPIVFCNQEIEEIDLLLDQEVDIETKRGIIEVIDNNCLSFSSEKNLIEDSRWRDPSIIYIFPGKEGLAYGSVFLSILKEEEAQFVYNDTSLIKRITPMENSIFSIYPFTIQDDPFERYIKLYRYYGYSDNIDNVNFEKKERGSDKEENGNGEENCGMCNWVWTVEEEGASWQSIEDNCEEDCSCIEPGDPGDEMGDIEITYCFLPAGGREPFYSNPYVSEDSVSLFSWDSPKILGSMEILRPYHIDTSSLVFFFSFVENNPPDWENGETSKIGVLSKSSFNLNSTLLKRWGIWTEDSPHSIGDCVDEDITTFYGSCAVRWVFDEEIEEGSWELYSYNCMSGSYCLYPLEDGDVSGEINRIKCEPEEEEDIIFHPCAGGMIIVKGSWGINRRGILTF